MVAVPTRFADEVARREGALGERWLAQLPATVGQLLHRWRLTPDGDALHGRTALVVPVRRDDGQEAVLKVSWPHEEARDEAAALRAWAGRGAVRLLADDPADWALLLERLDHRRSLAGEPEPVAVDAAAGALLALRAAPPPPGLGTTAQAAARWAAELPADWRALGRPGPARLVAAAASTAAALAEGTATARSVHGDLHYGNVLRAPDRPWGPWVAIDPKPLAGDPEFDVLPLLRNRWDDVVATGDAARACRGRLARVVDVAGLDLDRARAWSLVRTVDDALWGAEHGEVRFASIGWAIAEALLPGG